MAQTVITRKPCGCKKTEAALQQMEQRIAALTARVEALEANQVRVEMTWPKLSPTSTVTTTPEWSDAPVTIDWR